jgi:hypothetical protein
MIAIHVHIDERLARGARRVGRALRRGLLIAGALLLLAIPLTLVAAPVDLPNQFEPGTPASASEINANFDELAAAVDDKDERLAQLELARPLPSAGGVTAYVTTTDNVATRGSFFNSRGGDVTVTGTTGDYAATFQNLTCVQDGAPLGVATVVPYVSSTAVNCRIGTITQVANDCEIAVRCFDSAGSLRAGAIGLSYVQ